MRWTSDLTGADPIIRDHLVYDAALLDYGELLMLGATAATDQPALITAYNATDANSAIDAVGMLNEDTYESGGTVPSGDPASSSGNYGKVIINPFSVYRVEASQAAADDVAITSTSTTTITVSSLSDNIDGYWVYSPVGDSIGSLRLLTAAASGSATMDSAWPVTGDSSDTIIVVVPPFMYANNIEATAKNSASGNAQAISGATNMRVVQTIIQQADGRIEPLTVSFAGLDNLNVGNGVKFFNDVVLKDHAFGAQE